MLGGTGIEPVPSRPPLGRRSKGDSPLLLLLEVPMYTAPKDLIV
jgi:hypothetical protein